MTCHLHNFPLSFGNRTSRAVSAGLQTLKGLVAASFHLEQGLWLQQPHSPIVHLHNGCLFIHYANSMGGKLGNKGRRKEKIAVACFNILFISKLCGLQKSQPQSTACAWEFVFSPFSYELSQVKKKSYFSLAFSASFIEPSEQYNVQCRKKSKLKFHIFESGLSASSILILDQTQRIIYIQW